MSFPAAFSVIETLELFCAEDHQINFVTSTEVSVLNGHHKQVAQAWLEPVSWLARIQDLAGRAKAMRKGRGETTFKRPLSLFADFWQARGGRASRVFWPVYQGVRGVLLRQDLLTQCHPLPAIRARLPCRHRCSRLRDVLTMPRVIRLTRRSERILLREIQ